MVGRDDACEDAWVAAHQAWLGRGEAERAARCAFWHALGLFPWRPRLAWVGSLAEVGLTGSPPTPSRTCGCGCCRPCRLSSKEMLRQPLRVSARRVRSQRLADVGRDRFREDWFRLRVDPARADARRYGATGRGHGQRHGRGSGTDDRGDRLLPSDRPLPSRVRRPSREGVDGRAHTLV